MPPAPDPRDRAATYQVRVLDRAIDILDTFTPRRRELSIPEIVRATGLNRSTAIRLVANLERRGLLEHGASKGRYRLGQRLFQMGRIVNTSFSLLEAAAKPLSALEVRSGATIVLAIRNGEHSVTVDKRQGVGDGYAMVPLPSEVGDVKPLTYGPIGQVLLATLPPETVGEILEKYPLEQYTPYSVTDRARVLERLAAVRGRGYALEVNEVLEGLMGIAAPIFDLEGDLAGVLSLGLPATRENDQEFVATAIRDLKQAAAEISANMGYPGGGPEAEADAEIPAGLRHAADVQDVDT